MTSIGTLSFLIVLLLVPESPKWLLINGRKQEAVEASMALTPKFMMMTNLKNLIIQLMHKH
jgi:hypothetical protein